MEGSGKSSDQQNYRIPKKVSNSKPDVVHIQSPLSRFEEIYQWQYSVQGWPSRPKNKKIDSNWKRYCIGDEGSVLRQPKVILTNILKTELGRKYIHTELINDANLSHGVILQSDQQTSSVDTVDILHILSPLHQPFLSKRQPKVILTNILRTKAGRKYIQNQLLNDANLSDANKLQSDEQPFSSITNLKSCQALSSQQRCVLSKRCGRYQKRLNDQKRSKDAEVNHDLMTLKRCDVLLEDCSTKNKRGDWAEKEQKDSKNLSPCLRKASSQNNKSRKRRSDILSNQWSAVSPQKSFLKEQRTESVQSSGCQGSRENCQNHMHNLQPENVLQLVESDCNATLHTGIIDCGPSENYSVTSSIRKQHSFTKKDKCILPLVCSAREEKVTKTLQLKKPLNKSEMNKETTDSSEPIVLSSDEEERSVDIQVPECGKSHELEYNDKNQETVVLRSENLSHSMTESKTKQVSADPLSLHSSADHSTISECMDLALDIKFETLYIGKYKGAAAGCVRFTGSCITIPFEVPGNKKIELSVDSMQLKRFGLWSNKDTSESGHSAVIFLWLSSDYMEQVEKQLETTLLNRQAKSTKFIFIQLSQMLTEEDQVMLQRIIVEVSTKINSSDLSVFLSWESVIEEIACEESAFMSDWYKTFQKYLEKNRTSVPAEEPSAEVKLSLNKFRYTLLQKQHSKQYSFSISSVNENEWKELQETGPMKNLIVYPPPPSKGGLGVTREDLECLEYGEFLNDVIIDFYLKYLLLEKAPKQLADRSHIFSSFFYKCLTRSEKNSEENPKLSIAQKRHRRVKRWTRYINIFNKDYIFVPVNEESHWYIAIICFPWLEQVVYKNFEDMYLPQTYFQQFSRSNIGAVRKDSVLVLSDTWCDTEQLDINSNLHTSDDVQSGIVDSELTSKKSSGTSKVKKICRRPCILILDSLKASSVKNTVQVLREYLEAEWEAKRKTYREFSKSTMVDFCPRVPKQDNNSDCGIYLLQYVETFFQNPIVNFEVPVHLEQWFPRHLVRSKREQIRDLILQLHLQQQSGSKS